MIGILGEQSLYFKGARAPKQQLTELVTLTGNYRLQRPSSPPVDKIPGIIDRSKENPNLSWD